METASKSRKLSLAVVFGLAFGFLLQKGGVAKYHVLEGQLLLENFTVIKIMLTAILVGMIGHYYQHKFGVAKDSIKPFRPYANIIGGAIFGIGFACSGFCPGTGAAALGQGDFEALYYMAGMLVGSYVYAEASEFTFTHLEKVKDLGKLTLDHSLRMSRGAVVSIMTVIISAVLIFLKSA